MKKFYTLLTMLVLLAAGAFTATAANVTVIVDDPDAIQIGRNVYDTTTWTQKFESLVDEVSDINNFDIDGSVNFDIKANDNYVITSVKDADDSEKLYSSPARSCNIYEWQGDTFTYVVSTKKIDELFTASCTINVDDPSKVRLRTGGSLGQDITLEGTTTILKFDPVSKDANQLQLGPVVSSVPLYEVKLNDEVQTPIYGNYTLTLTDGCTVDITAIIPDKDVTVKVNVPEDCKGVFKAMQKMKEGSTYEYEDLAGDFLSGVTLKAGTSLKLVLDADAYSIDNFKVNGTDTYISGGSYSFAIMDNTTFDVEAHAYKSFDVDFAFDDYTHVKMFKGSNNWGTAFDLTDNNCQFSFSEKSSETRTVYIQAASGFFIKKIIRTDADNNKTEWTAATSVELSEGCSVKVTTGIQTTDGILHVWLDPALAPSITKIKVTDGYGYTKASCDEPVAGVNTLDISSLVSGGGYSYNTLSLERSNSDPMYISVNEGEAYLDSYGSISIESNKLRGTDIYRFFAANPDRHDVTFDAGDLNKENFTITVDKMPVDEWDSNRLFAGSGVNIASNDGSRFYVKLNDAAAVESVEGVHTFTVKGNTAVKLSATSSAITAVEADAADAATRTVYNLQGIRVDANNLPAGIYIINGKKVAVK